MNYNRRRILLALSVLSLLPPPLWAQAPVHVVKVLNFSCARSRALEAHDAAIATAVAEGGGQFVFAPVSWGEQSDARDRVYYAARSFGSAIEQRVRAALYAGAQDSGLPFEDIPQVIVWLQQELGEAFMDWNAIMKGAYDPDTTGAVSRAVRLAVRAGVDGLPAYVFVRGSEPVALLDPEALGTAAPLALKDAVLRKYSELTGKKD